MKWEGTEYPRHNYKVGDSVDLTKQPPEGGLCPIDYSIEAEADTDTDGDGDESINLSEIGLSFDKSALRITGTATTPGVYVLAIVAESANGIEVSAGWIISVGTA